MANDIVTTQRNPIQIMGNALVRVNAHPGLSDSAGSTPRTILVGRILAGASDSDLLVAHILCLSRAEVFGIAILGEPAGPTFKTHPADKRARFESDDPGAVGAFVDWRFSLPSTTVVASFDPSCAGALIETAELFRSTFPDVPIDVIFLAARDEKEPGLVHQLRARVGKVIMARPSSMRSRFDPSEEVDVPALPRNLLEDYQACQGPLRTLAAGLQPGSQAMFAQSLTKFANALEDHLQ